MSLPDSILAVTLAFIAACWLTDVRTRQIPNVLSGSAFLAGVLMNVLFFGRWGLASSVAGAAVGVVFLIGPFALGGIGGGDVKMMGAVGALLGPLLVLHALAVGLILGGIVMMASRRRGSVAREVGVHRADAHGCLVGEVAEPLRLSDEDVAAVTLPYSVPWAWVPSPFCFPVGILGPLF
jgi:prepilin peptidase CpaA